VGRSASRDESRPVLTGILVRFEPGRIVMAATDSYRLAVKETPVEAALPDLEAIIPARALQELARIAVGADEVQLGLQENHVVFVADGTWARHGSRCRRRSRATQWRSASTRSFSATVSTRSTPRQ